MISRALRPLETTWDNFKRLRYASAYFLYSIGPLWTPLQSAHLLLGSGESSPDSRDRIKFHPIPGIRFQKVLMWNRDWVKFHPIPKLLESGSSFKMLYILSDLIHLVVFSHNSWFYDMIKFKILDLTDFLRRDPILGIGWFSPDPNFTWVPNQKLCNPIP